MKAEKAGSKYGWKEEYNHYFDGLEEFRHETLRASRNIRLMRLASSGSRSDVKTRVNSLESLNPVSSNSSFARIYNNTRPDDLAYWPLAVTLYEVSIDDHPPYKTISYVNGPPDRRAIICDDQYLLVSRSCALALYHLSCDLDISTECLVWADQICINQNDPIEKGQQVALMASIYSSSTVTIAWLGEPNEPLEELFGTFDKLLSNSLIGDENGIRYKHAGIAALFANPWFRRAWVIQEAALSRTLQLFCGCYVISWECLMAFYRASFVWPRWELPDREVIHGFHQLRQVFKDRGTQSLTLRQGLNFTLSTAVSDQRDRLYALCGICTAVRTLVGAPDYTVKPSEVYLKFACQMVDQFGPNSAVLWQIIDIYGTGLDESDELPTWAPAFSRGQQSCLTHPFVKNTEFSLLDQIVTLTGNPTGDDSDPSIVPSRALSCQCVDIGTIGDQLWTGAKDLHRDLLNDGQAVQQTVQELCEYSIDGNGAGIRVDHGRPGDLMYRLVQDSPMDRATLLPFNDAPEWSQMRVFASTSRSLVLAPVLAASGDKIVLFEGNVLSGQLSVVRGSEDGTWEYVGTCFVLGWKRHNSQKAVMELGTCEVTLR